jgi:hypothetical protein
MGQQMRGEGILLEGIEEMTNKDTYLDDGAFPDELTKDYTRGGRLLAAIEDELDGTVEAIEDEVTLPYIRVR